MANRKSEELHDAIQERCIRAKDDLGLNANQIADAVDGKISRQHVYDFFNRRKPMGSQLLQHLLPVLKLDGWLK